MEQATDIKPETAEHIDLTKCTNCQKPSIGYRIHHKGHKLGICADCNKLLSEVLAETKNSDTTTDIKRTSELFPLDQ